MKYEIVMQDNHNHSHVYHKKYELPRATFFALFISHQTFLYVYTT